MENTRKLTIEEIHRRSEELRSWNRWGQDDEVGTLNLATPEKIVEAAKLVRKGETFALAINFDANGPQWGGLGRFNPVHAMTATGIDAIHGVQDDMKIRYAEDLLALPIHAATHWDSLSHIFYDTYLEECSTPLCLSVRSWRMRGWCRRWGAWARPTTTPSPSHSSPP